MLESRVVLKPLNVMCSKLLDLKIIQFIYKKNYFLLDGLHILSNKRVIYPDFNERKNEGVQNNPKNMKALGRAKKGAVSKYQSYHEQTLFIFDC